MKSINYIVIFLIVFITFGCGKSEIKYPDKKGEGLETGFESHETIDAAQRAAEHRIWQIERYGW